MLEAKSMYFGGEIISADECDYQTSRQLGLICPFCSSAVFVRSESVRQTKKGLQLVRPYFAHYPSGSDIDWDCERRAHSKAGRDEIERIKITAREQRLRLYNAHLWKMIADDRNISHQKLNSIRSMFGESWCQRVGILTRAEWKRSLDSAYTFIDEAIAACQHGEIDHVPKPVALSSKDWAEEIEKQKAYTLQCDRRLHRAICFEVADFLGTNTGGFAFDKIFRACVWMEIAIGLDQNMVKRAQPREHLAMISAFIAGTHWADQINKRLSDPQTL